MSLAIGSGVGENAMLELRNTFDSGDTREFNDMLQKYNVKYVLVDKSLVKGRYGHSLDWKIMDEYSKGWKNVWSENFLTLYSIGQQDTGYKEYLGSNISLSKGLQEIFYVF